MDGQSTAVGSDAEVMPLAGPGTKLIDLKRRSALPGLIDNHLHIIRGGLSFSMELRWDGVRSLADAMAMPKQQVAITPPQRAARGRRLPAGCLARSQGAGMTSKTWITA